MVKDKTTKEYKEAAMTLQQYRRFERLQVIEKKMKSDKKKQKFWFDYNRLMLCYGLIIPICVLWVACGLAIANNKHEWALLFGITGWLAFIPLAHVIESNYFKEKFVYEPGDEL